MRFLKTSNILTFFTIICTSFIIYLVYLNNKPKPLPEKVNKTLYIDRSFSENEILSITKATEEWSSATKNKVNYDIKILPQEKIDKNSIIINKASEDTPEIILVDLLNEKTTLGYFSDNREVPFIYVVSSRLESYDELKAVILHELGHSLGMNHIPGPDGYNTLMSPNMGTGSNTITDKDIEQFCNLYKCLK